MDELGCIRNEVFVGAVYRIYGEDGVLSNVGMPVFETRTARWDERL